MQDTRNQIKQLGPQLVSVKVKSEEINERLKKMMQQLIHFPYWPDWADFVEQFDVLLQQYQKLFESINPVFSHFLLQPVQLDPKDPPNTIPEALSTRAHPEMKTENTTILKKIKAESGSEINYGEVEERISNQNQILKNLLRDCESLRRENRQPPVSAPKAAPQKKKIEPLELYLYAINFGKMK